MATELEVVAIPPGYTEKEWRFCKEYSLDFNGERAAREAGYSDKTAAQIAYRMLTKPKIQKYLQEIRMDLQEQYDVTAEKVINQLNACAFFDINDFIDFDGKDLNVKALADIPAKWRPAIAGIEQRTTKEGTHFVIKFYNRLDAIEKLMKHFGLYAPTEVNIKDEREQSVKDAEEAFQRRLANIVNSVPAEFRSLPVDAGGDSEAGV